MLKRINLAGIYLFEVNNRITKIINKKLSELIFFLRKNLQTQYLSDDVVSICYIVISFIVDFVLRILYIKYIHNNLV